MSQIRIRRKSAIKQELDLAEHATRLRGLPGNSWLLFRRILVVLASGVVLLALGWLALSR